MTTWQDREAIYAQVETTRQQQESSGFTPETDRDVLPATWREERDVQERRAMALDRPREAQRRALLKIAALAVAQIEALDARRG